MSGVDEIVRGAVASDSAKRSAGSRRIPQVSLLPVEIRDAAQTRRTRIALAAAVVAVAAVVGVATAAAGAAADDAEARSSAASARAASATGQLSKFKDVQDLQARIALDTAAVRVGSSTAIDWQRQFAAITADLPAGFTVTTIQADSATPYEAYAQGTSPLEKQRVATVQITVSAPSLQELPVWLRELKSLPAYADLATPAYTRSDDGSTVQVVLHLSPKAYITPLKGTR